MSQKYEKLKTLLKELFQLDQPDLDFGLYRIMHAKGDEVTQFLDRDLLPQVKDAFRKYKSKDKAALESELSTLIAQADAIGADPDALPKVKELREKIATEAVDIDALESTVYDHLFTFFRRYYSDGDFLAKRVYRPGVYAIPYEGEEVKLHWANRDQYYIKTDEYLRDYTFCLRPDNDGRPMRVHFRLLDATEGPHDNSKTAEGKDRVFVLAPGGDSGRDFIVSAGAELSICFEYRPATLSDWPTGLRDGRTKPPTQKDLIEPTISRLLSTTDSALTEWLAELKRLDPTEKNPARTVLEKHFNKYSAANKFDYFIHKDLDRFLRRELDFFIKNEVMHLDDVESDQAPRVEQYLSQIKVIRRIAGKIIDFLAQLEDFQKTLWLKKKFVLETQYCIRIDRVPDGFYPEVAANEAQREEWVKLLAINEIVATLVSPGYSLPLTVEFLKAHPTLFVDTRHFAADTAASMVEAVGSAENSEGLDHETGVLLVHSENFGSSEKIVGGLGFRQFAK